MSQTERVFDILYRLSIDGGMVTLSEISDCYGISDRQASRDIEYIRGRILTNPSSIVYDRAKHGYLLNDSSVISSWRERMIISLALYDASSYDTPVSSEFSANVSSSMKKVLSNIEYRVNRKAREHDERFIGRIIRSFDEDLAIELLYRKRKDEDAELRLVEPLKLINYDNSWYLLSFDISRSAVRTFRLSRVEELRLTPRKTEKRRREDIERLSKSAYGIFMTASDPVEYTIRFTGGEAVSVSSETWHPAQNSRWSDEDSYELTIPVMGMRELLARVLSYGKDAVPVSPEEFVKAYWTEVDSMWERRREHEE